MTQSSLWHILEANHDIEMLKNGSYPWPLKKRILGDKGHLSNVAAGETLSELMSGKTKFAFLGHLSNENNEPHLAYETVEKILEKNGVKVGTYFKLDMAARYSNSLAVEM